MPYINDVNAEMKGVELSIFSTFHILLKRWWIILIAIVMGSSICLTYGQLTKIDYYTSSLKFVVNNKAGDSTDSNGDITASIKLANTYKEILKSKVMAETVSKKCQIKVNKWTVYDAIEVKAVKEANIIYLDVTTTDANLSYQIADTINKNYGEVVESAGLVDGKIQSFEIYEKASVPNSNHSVTRLTIIGFFVSLIAAVIFIIISNALKDTIQNIDDIQSKLGLETLGVIAHVAAEDKNSEKKAHLISQKNTPFSFIETYKAIRTKIEGYAAKNDYKVFIISSASEGEGKTTVAANISIALSQNGRSVLLIDADLRKPSISKFLSVSSGPKSKGLSDAITGVTSIENAVKYSEKYKLFLITGTLPSDDPAELLSTDEFAKIIENAREEFDFIILDTAPAGVVTDASVVASVSDAVLLVVREDFSSTTRIRMAIQDLSSSRSEVIGCIYNDASVKGSIYKGKYSRYGSYGYGAYGYGGYGYDYSSKPNSTDLKEK